MLAPVERRETEGPSRRTTHASIMLTVKIHNKHVTSVNFKSLLNVFEEGAIQTLPFD